MDITDVSILHHAGIVLVVLWLLSLFNRCHPIAYFFSFIYLYLVHERYVMRLRRKLQFEERKEANQRRVLTDSETVRWLNHVVEKMWPICMEQIASQKILLPIIPWFLEKYKPWTAKKAVVQHLYLGRNPPVFTEMRVLRQSTGDDHLVLELGMNFLTAEDMSTILAVKLRKRLGFGMWAKLHLTGMHVEGKVLVGVKFLRNWPFLGRLRICFAEPPYFQMTVKPIFTHGLDVTVLPGIAGWLDKLLSIAFEQTLVEPNMLVVDLEKFVSPQADDSWFSVDEKEAVGYAKVEVIEASDMKPSDLNGLADPYVKGQLGPYRLRTKVQKKTLAPKWHEEFKIPICTWESTNVLAIEVCDKDHFVDDTLGDCSVNISDLRDGQRHDMWLPLQNIKMGRLRIAITVLEDNANTIIENDAKGVAHPYDKETLNKEDIQNSFSSETAHNASFSSISSDKAPTLPDNFEPINIEGQNETGIWVHQPGSEVAQIWEPRKAKSRRSDTHVCRLPNDPLGGSNPPASGSIKNDSSSGDENGERKNPIRSLQLGFRKISAVFHRSPRKEDYSGSLGEPVDSPYANLKAVSEKEIGVKFIVEDNLVGPASGKSSKEGSTSADGSGPESPSKGHVKDMAKSILKHAGKGARNIRHVLSRKGSTKFPGDTSVVTLEDINAESDSSDDESLSSPQVKSTPAISNPMSSCCGNNGSCDHKEQIVQGDGGEPATKIDGKTDDINVANLESQDREELSDTDRRGNGLVDSSSPRLPGDNLEVEKG